MQSTGAGAEGGKMQKTFNAKTQRCEGARVLNAIAGSFWHPRFVLRNLPAARVWGLLVQLCVLGSLQFYLITSSHSAKIFL
jgi:hypothetical protein